MAFAREIYQYCVMGIQLCPLFYLAILLENKRSAHTRNILLCRRAKVQKHIAIYVLCPPLVSYE